VDGEGNLLRYGGYEVKIVEFFVRKDEQEGLPSYFQ
jgi:hypothetical protein